MPTLLRIPYCCDSVSAVTSWSSKKMRPESGLTSPMADFSSMVLPLPAAPITTSVSPGPIAKDRLTSAGTSPKCRLTLSNRRMDESVPITVSPRHQVKVEDEYLIDKERHHENPDGGNHYGLRGRLTDALRAAGGAQPVEASH